jgi:ABC-type Fe3+-hydroxamate transport system substrate-binding protein
MILMNLISRFMRMVILFVSALCVTSAWSATVEVTDALGRKVKITTPVHRVVLNFNFEEFTAVTGKEGWTKVVGISRAPWEGWRPAIFSRYAAVLPNLQAMPDNGNTDDGTFSAEKVIALKPDVLFVAEWTYKSLQTARDQIEAAGIPIVVIDYNAQMLERHISSTLAIGKVMGTEQRSQELASLYEREYKSVLARIAKAGGASNKKVYVELGQAGPETIGNSYSGTMWGKLFTTLGAVNIADGKLTGPWGPLNAEAVIAENPDLIFIAGSSWVNKPKAVKTGYDATPEITRKSLDTYAQRAGWSGMKAIKNGEMHAIEHGLCRTLFDFVAMQYIAKRLYPDAFKDVDPDASFRAYHAKYLPVAYSGTWMLPLKP